MIIGDDKKAIMTIMAKRHPKDGTGASSPMKVEKKMSEGGEVDGRHEAAQDAIMAMHEKSPAKLMQALVNFMEIHDSMKHNMPEGLDEQEDDTESVD